MGLIDWRATTADGVATGGGHRRTRIGFHSPYDDRWSRASRRSARFGSHDELVKISTSLDYAGDFRAAATRAVDLERAGVDRVWVAEAYGFDAISLLGYLAAKTETIELATGIINVFSRSPALIAQTAAGLDALSEGRFVLGLGASGPQVIEGWHGVPYDRPLTRIREVIDICRMAWKRERLVYDGKTVTLPLPADRGTGLGKPLKMITTPVREHIPIHIASLGHRSVEAAAAVADGWLPFLFAPEYADRVWGSALAAGTAQRSVDLATLDITAGGLFAIGPDAAALREKARPFVALYVGGMGAKGKNFYNDVARAYGFEREAEAVQDLYLAGRKDEAMAALPADLLEKTTLCGDAAYIRDRLAAFRAAGVTTLNVTPVDGDPLAQIAKLRALID
jgi:F420-dependent oxidoreductase-like protein